MANQVRLAVLTGLVVIAGITALPRLASADSASLPEQSQSRVERHPELRKALAELEEARADLNKAAHDFDGKRAAALKDTDHAIAEVRAAMNTDRH